MARIIRSTPTLPTRGARTTDGWSSASWSSMALWSSPAEAPRERALDAVDAAARRPAAELVGAGPGRLRQRRGGGGRDLRRCQHVERRRLQRELPDRSGLHVHRRAEPVLLHRREFFL